MGTPLGSQPTPEPETTRRCEHFESPGDPALGGSLLPNLRSASSHLADGIQIPLTTTSFGKNLIEKRGLDVPEKGGSKPAVKRTRPWKRLAYRLLNNKYLFWHLWYGPMPTCELENFLRENVV